MTERDRPAEPHEPTCPACHGSGIVSAPYIGEWHVNRYCDCPAGVRAEEGANEE